MKFILKEKTKKDVEKEREGNAERFHSSSSVDHRICPLEITLSNGKTVDVWELSETEIINLINSQMSEMTNQGFKDIKGANNTSKVLQCWKEKHQVVSVDFIESCFQLEKRYEKHKSTVKDLTTPIIFEQLNEAKIIADYLNGMQGDKKEITNENYLKILRNKEMIAEQRKERKLNK